VAGAVKKQSMKSSTPSMKKQLTVETESSHLMNSDRPGKKTIEIDTKQEIK